MIISSNIQAKLSVNSLWHRNNALEKASTNLSIGTRVNKTGDAPATYAISNKMKLQIRGIDMADKNANNAISLLQTADGGMGEMQNIVQRMRELAVQSSNDTLTDDDRKLIQKEVSHLSLELDEISEKIEFNKKKLLNADYENFTFQLGASTGQEFSVSLKKVDAKVLGLSIENAPKYDINGNLVEGTETALDYTTLKGSQDAIQRCDDAIDRINNYRANLGAAQNRLENTSSALVISGENGRKSLSTLIDTDMAGEMSEYTKNNILVQASISMLSQANQRPNQLLSLLQ